MEASVKNQDLKALVIQFENLQYEVLTAATKNLVYKLWKTLKVHQADFIKLAKELAEKRATAKNKKAIDAELLELAEQKINITFQPVDWNKIIKDSEGKERDLARAYEFDDISLFFTNYK